MDQSTAVRRIRDESRSLRDDVSRFESPIPGIVSPLTKTTAAATTGPASGPRPTSSTPATRRIKVGPSQLAVGELLLPLSYLHYFSVA